MIVRRVETRPAPEPPVRFYRTIAVSFLAITIILLGVVIFFTSKKADITIITKNDNKNINMAVFVEKDHYGANSITGVVTTTIVRWSEKYYPASFKTIESPAEGEVIIYNKTNIPQILVKTTRLLTPDGILFRLSEKVTVPANGEIIAKVYSDKEGKAGNIPPSQFIIPGLSSEKQKFIYAESKKPMEGGERKIGVLSAEDLKAAEADFAEKIKAAAPQDVPPPDVWYTNKATTIVDRKISCGNKVGEEVAEFVLNGTSKVLVVFYNQEELAEMMEKEIEKKINPDIERIMSMSSEPQVSVASYDLAKGTAQLAVYQNIVATLDANAEKLLPYNFFGKSKEEIERYVVGLDHVSGVEVKFSPMWTRNAPSVPDNIKITVENVQ